MLGGFTVSDSAGHQQPGNGSGELRILQAEGSLRTQCGSKSLHGGYVRGF